MESEDTVRELDIPESMNVVMLSWLHDAMGHRGRDRTVGITRERGYWPGMWKYIETYVDNYKMCAIAKACHLNVNMCSISSKIMGEIIAIDFTTLDKCKGDV